MRGGKLFGELLVSRLSGHLPTWFWRGIHFSGNRVNQDLARSRDVATKAVAVTSANTPCRQALCFWRSEPFTNSSFDFRQS